MNEPLTEAPTGRALTLVKVLDPDLALKLSRMGLFEGSEITKLEQEVLVHPVRVRGPKRDAVLGGGMAMKIVVHLDGDEGKLPLTEMRPGQAGHIEGLTGGPYLFKALETLGLKPDDRIEFLRKLPPMEYVAVLEHNGRIHLTEGMAAKIWGRMQDKQIQFVSSKVGEKFHVDEILGGTNAVKMLEEKGVRPGRTMVLEKVAQAQALHIGVRNPVVVSSSEGLRLFLSSFDANKILVREAEDLRNK